jgi:hypothetical protein
MRAVVNLVHRDVRGLSAFKRGLVTANAEISWLPQGLGPLNYCFGSKGFPFAASSVSRLLMT